MRRLLAESASPTPATGGGGNGMPLWLNLVIGAVVLVFFLWLLLSALRPGSGPTRGGGGTWN